jgi:hypothetical protein
MVGPAAHTADGDVVRGRGQFPSPDALDSPPRHLGRSAALRSLRRDDQVLGERARRAADATARKLGIDVTHSSGPTRRDEAKANTMLPKVHECPLATQAYVAASSRRVCRSTGGIPTSKRGARTGSSQRPGGAPRRICGVSTFPDSTQASAHASLSASCRLRVPGLRRMIASLPDRKRPSRDPAPRRAEEVCCLDGRASRPANAPRPAACWRPSVRAAAKRLKLDHAAKGRNDIGHDRRTSPVQAGRCDPARAAEPLAWWTHGRADQDPRPG